MDYCCIIRLILYILHSKKKLKYTNDEINTYLLADIIICKIITDNCYR